MGEIKDNIIKCTQCGASLPINRNVCEYCGSVYKVDIQDESIQEDELGKKGDIISDLGKVNDLFDAIFDLPFIDD